MLQGEKQFADIYSCISVLHIDDYVLQPVYQSLRKWTENWLTRAELRSDQLTWIEEMKGVNKVMFMHSLEKILIYAAGSASDDGSEAAGRENLSHSKHRGYLVALKKQTSGVWLCGDTWELQSDNQGNFHALSCNAFSCNLLQAAHRYTPQLL